MKTRAKPIEVQVQLTLRFTCSIANSAIEEFVKDAIAHYVVPGSYDIEEDSIVKAARKVLSDPLKARVTQRTTFN